VKKAFGKTKRAFQERRTGEEREDEEERSAVSLAPLVFRTVFVFVKKANRRR